MENKLIVKKIGEEFKNRFGYPSRKVTFYDPQSNLKKEIYLHRGHAGYYDVWRKIEKNDYESIFYGEIKEIPIDEDLIRSVHAYKEAKIIDFQPCGIFVFFKYRDLSQTGNQQMALKNQLWQYVNVEDELFDIDELTEDEYLIK